MANSPKQFTLNNSEFSEFLVNKPLYSKVVASMGSPISYHGHRYFDDKAFKFLCPNEKEIQTFRTTFDPPLPQQISSPHGAVPAIIPSTFNNPSRKLNLLIHLLGICQSCGERINFFIRSSSDKSWDEGADGITVYIEKIGQYPSYAPLLNKTLQKYLTEEDQENYKRALICKSTGYGIGAYAYLRRVIENEIKKIIKDISGLEFDGVDKVKEAFATYEKDHQMGKLIEVLDQNLPITFKDLGNNPVKLLYDQLSGGIHLFTDEVCLKKAENIDILINFVIEKINEAGNKLKGVRAAMKNLQSGE